MELALAYVVAASVFVMLALGIKAFLSQQPYALAGLAASAIILIGHFEFIGIAKLIRPDDPLALALKHFAVFAGLVSFLFLLPTLMKMLPSIWKWLSEMQARQQETFEREKASLLPGYVFYHELLSSGADPAQAKLNLVAGDFDTSRKGCLRPKSILLPAMQGEGYKEGAQRPVVPIYREYQLSDVTDCAVAADGQPRSLASTYGAGAATALVFGPLMGLGAGALLATRNDLVLVALRFTDNKRVLAQLKKPEVVKLQFALDSSPAAGRQAVAPWNDAASA